jgi:type II secretory pathway pseudopilin PulG
MKTQKGFGLIGLLITLAIIVGIAFTSYYSMQNTGTVDSLNEEHEKQNINSAIKQAENVKQRVEGRNAEITNLIDGWKTYSNASAGIKFKYPPHWNLPETAEDFFGDEAFGTYYEIDNFDGDFFWGGVVNNSVTEEGHGGSYASCQYHIDSVDEFCEFMGECVRVNNKTAYDYSFVYHGEGGISGLVYTNASPVFPSICFEIPLDEIWEKIRDGIDYEDDQGNYDVEQYIEKANLSESTLREIDNIKLFADSIDKWTP